MFPVIFLVPPLAAIGLAVVVAAQEALQLVQPQLLPNPSQRESRADVFSKSVSACPGEFCLISAGLTAQLQLAGPGCNAFGHDFKDLTVEVTYEETSRPRVNIRDTKNKQFTIPETIISRPGPSNVSLKNQSDLVFNYEELPFAFWITRRSQPSAAPLFDMRLSSLPPPTSKLIIPDDNSTTLEGFPLVFEDQYLQSTSALPVGTNLYGLGEVVASSGFRRDVGQMGGTVQTMWARDAADPVDENVYGSHAFYLEHRFNQDTRRSQSHGVFLMNPAGADILLLTPPGSNISLIQYRLIGGTFDFYFFSGPTPKNVIEQYGQFIGLPTWQPIWGFGFHLCRYGYYNVDETREQVRRMREANIPLEVMWNDIDLYHANRDFTTDPVSFPAESVRALITELHNAHQRYIPIVDAAIPKTVNATDSVSSLIIPYSLVLTLLEYDPYTEGAKKNLFITNPDGSEYIGQVWPGLTVFPDWFHEGTQQWWTDALRNWSQSGVEFSGIWLDMNEASSFRDGSCGTGADLPKRDLPFILPGVPGAVFMIRGTNCPERYDVKTSGNTTIYDASTCQPELNVPPYAIHNEHTLATNATHVNGVVELDVHNLFGLMEEKATHMALLEILAGKRPFLISRSTFPSSGKWTGHWLEDNFSLWSYMKYNIAGVLQFQLFQIPFVGADTCGFMGNADEELCNRWMQLSAFTPFYRNHNARDTISQEPYRWDSVANASREVMAIRYSLLPYWVVEIVYPFANASRFGTPPVRALFFEFPDETEIYEIAKNGTTILSAPLGHINIHVLDGAAILLYASPAYTITETRHGPFSLLVSQTTSGHAFGTAYLDDGESNPPGPSKKLTITSVSCQVRISGQGSFRIDQKLDEITVLGVFTKPSLVSLNGDAVKDIEYQAQQAKLVN
ncbi:glycoside hydrolase family 31 protein [Amanita thiersii Skay4041]|uniref:Glycoside hydrolase family 31 protein n=1 Tax=Amanita thiersii Skay4041 TaxID=703135 RepID=A0A2A9NEA8_9AGAR|nr:glycoside hydrolase family 31 protein [Amanita thiersii Skay4041]